MGSSIGLVGTEGSTAVAAGAPDCKLVLPVVIGLLLLILLKIITVQP